ncbi:hypothetical protein NDU88_001762 [Pleurodeles waltl]|uniref:Uncharacterized protein n=1 Tax=Pleurodeles waltl TaxID=8319 RepID=A0AAV7Q714_PLEWA|nr:hypothetical protein NDU88_001762 [Pleurodeles waltl]
MYKPQSLEDAASESRGPRRGSIRRRRGKAASGPGRLGTENRSIKGAPHPGARSRVQAPGGASIRPRCTSTSVRAGDPDKRLEPLICEKQHPSPLGERSGAPSPPTSGCEDGVVGAPTVGLTQLTGDSIFYKEPPTGFTGHERRRAGTVLALHCTHGGHGRSWRPGAISPTRPVLKEEKIRHCCSNHCIWH